MIISPPERPSTSFPVLNVYSFKASQIFNKRVLGEQQVKFETMNYPKANYLNPSLSIMLPIFAIHGNHDDIVGLD